MGDLDRGTWTPYFVGHFQTRDLRSDPFASRIPCTVNWASVAKIDLRTHGSCEKWRPQAPLAPCENAVARHDGHRSWLHAAWATVRYRRLVPSPVPAISPPARKLYTRS